MLYVTRRKKSRSGRIIGEESDSSWRHITYIQPKKLGKPIVVLVTSWNFGLEIGTTEICRSSDALIRYARLIDMEFKTIKEHKSELDALKYHIKAIQNANEIK